jgi:hypothetical protein
MEIVDERFAILHFVPIRQNRKTLTSVGAYEPAVPE